MRVLAVLLVLVATGCAPRLASFDARPSAVVASAQDVAAGAALHVFQAADGRWGYMTATGDVVLPARFESAGTFHEGRAVVRVGGRAGFIDPAGRVVVEPRYTSVDPFSDGRARVAVGEGDRTRYGFIAPDGAEVVPPSLPMAYGFSDGRAIARLRSNRVARLARLLSPLGATPRRDEFVLLDRDGQILRTLPHWEVLPFSADLAPFEAQNRQWGYLGPDGEVAIAPRFDGPAFLFTDGLARVGQNGRVGFVDSTGHVVIAPTYRLAGAFSEGLAAVEVAGLWGYIDRAGQTVIAPRFEEAGAFSEGLAVVQVDGRLGYVDPTGALVIAPQYRRAEAFRGGLALVGDDARVYSITPEGRRVEPPASR